MNKHIVTDLELLSAFEDLTLPFEQWTHRAHVRVAWLYLRHNTFEEALEKMRKGVKAYNARHHVPENATSGYNETTTRAFLHLIAATMRAYDSAFPVSDSESFCDAHPQLMSKHALRFFYSPTQRMDPRAKTEFMEPDLTPLPTIRSKQP